MESHEPGKENNENYIGTRVERNPLGTTQGGKFIMRIQHNISALNSYRQLNGNNNGLSKNLEKLSSGYRINRAGDDAAGLAISEKMRAQIRGLETAQKNSQDGISLVQTAEGALTEVHSMLNRMVELATQSSNGTFDNKTDRANLQKEVDSLKKEIDRISEATNFNGINLLDGSLGEGSIKAPDVSGVGTIDAAGQKAVFETTNAVSGGTNGQKGTFTVSYRDKKGEIQNVTVEYVQMGDPDMTAGAIVEELKKTELGEHFNITKNTAAGKLKFEGKKEDSNSPFIVGFSQDGTANPLNATNTKMGVSKNAAIKINTTFGNNQKITINGKEWTMMTTPDYSKGDQITVAEAVQKLNDAGYEIRNQKGELDAAGTANSYIIRKDGAAGGSMSLQIGDTNDDYNKLSFSIGDMSTKGLELEKIDVSTEKAAGDSIKIIKDAINKVSASRGDLGAVQNRLEHTIENLGVTTENMSAAEARIRDTDMAKEMMGYTKNNILLQASQAMLAQANQVPQGVLQLLQ